MCDASDNAFGVVLGQWIGKQPHVIYYTFITLNDDQLNYSTIENKLLAIIFAFEKFRSYIVCTKVMVFFDHATLRCSLMKKDAKKRLVRHILLLQKIDLEIKDKKRSENLTT